MTYDFLELSKKALDSLNDEEHNALKSLSKDQTIVISKADKGNAVVIQNKKDFMQKALDILLVSGKFAEVKDTSKKKLADYDPAYETIKRENKLQKLLRTLKNNGEIDNNVYKRVWPSNYLKIKLFDPQTI